MAIVLTNAVLVDIDPIGVERGCLRIDAGRIVERGANVQQQDGDEVVDCDGCVVLSGLVNGHTHLYSALATGMPAPPKSPTNFYEILQYVWWRLDRALDADAVEMSALVGGIGALRCGTTTLIDHHASPNCIEGSLDRVQAGLDRVGLRAVLCYETTDRNGSDGREAGIAENRRYLEKCAKAKNHQFAAMVGAHAAFTLDDASLDALATLADEFDTGVHIHVAEDPVDDEICRSRYGASLFDRLADHDLLKPETVVGHGTHLQDDAIARLGEVGLTLAHNPRSNMNNAVGYTRVGEFECPIMLGTDGIGGDMFAEAHAAWFKSCDGRAGLSPNDVVAMLAHSAKRASDALGTRLGALRTGFAADVVITNYFPATPLTAEKLAGHLIFAMSGGFVKDVITRGSWAMRDRVLRRVDERSIRTDAVGVSEALWQRMGDIDQDRNVRTS